MSDISLNAGIRANLLTMQKTESLFRRTTERLGTGKKVNSAIDNPTNYFAAVNLNDRASGLNARLDSMGEAVQQIKAADNGINAIRSLLSSMKGIVNNALSQSDDSARVALGDQFNELLKQAADVASDSGYAGTNLLQGDSITVQFNESFDESTLDVSGFTVAGGRSGSAAANLEISGATATRISVAGSAAWGGTDYKADLKKVISSIENFEAELLNEAGSLANNLTVITVRENFTAEMINTLEEGADKLTLADLNEEGANLLALQTASQLATQSVALGSQQSQQVLQLLG